MSLCWVHPVYDGHGELRGLGPWLTPARTSMPVGLTCLEI